MSQIDRTGAPPLIGTGERAPSMMDVAKMAGVSHQTVSRVLNGHPSVRPATRQRVHTAIDALGYRRNAVARALVRRRTDTIGVIATGSSLHGPLSTLVGIEEAAREHDYFVTVATLRDYGVESLNRVLEHFLGHGVDGIVVIVPHDTVAHVIDHFRAPVPIVMITSREEGRGRPSSPWLSRAHVDQYGGARAVTAHLLDLGHRDVLHVSGPQDWFDARIRVRGWRDEMQERGLDSTRLAVGDWHASSGYAIGLDTADRIRAGHGPTAVFAANDEMALGMLRAFWERGVGVPSEVSVAGFDDVAGAGYFTPPLTTVRQPFDDLGRACLQRLLDMIRPADAEPRDTGTVRIQPSLSIRASTAPPR